MTERGTLDDAYPVTRTARQLPTVFVGDPIVSALVDSFDVLLAPAITALDSLDAHLDPELAPADFLQWMASWLGIPTGGEWSDKRRPLVSQAFASAGRRGTSYALRTLVLAAAPADSSVTVDEGSGPGWHPVVVRIETPEPNAVDRPAIDRLVERIKPAHLPHRVEVVRTG